MNRWTQDWQTNGHAKQITRQIYGLCIAVLSCGFLIADNIVHCRICNFQHHCLYSQLIHAMPCHATLYHVMAFNRCSSVIINSYSLAAIHSTAICFISYQQFFYLFFFLFFVVAFCLFGYTRLNCRSSSFILFTFFSPVSSSCCFCCCCCWVFFRNVSYLLAATMCMFDFEFILKCSVRSELATSPLMWFSTFFSVSN